MKDDPVQKAIRGARRRAKRDGLPFALTKEDMGAAPRRCPCCGVRMRRGDRHGGRRTTPTLERIVTLEGYVPGNVIWLCWLCNTTKSNLSLVQLYQIADFFHDEYRKRGIDIPTRGARR